MKTLQVNCSHIRNTKTKPPINIFPPPSEWQEWGEWSQCTSSCGQGMQMRARACVGECVGDSTETRLCSTSDSEKCFLSSVGFFDSVFTSSASSSNVTCCHPDNTFEEATCGRGASCEGQCSALGASLCPSGNCTDDPKTCELDINNGYTGSDLAWCTNSKHQCKVMTHRECCYNPNCLLWIGRKKTCAWLSALSGKNSNNTPGDVGALWSCGL